MLAELVDHVIGVDPDRDWITVAALDSRTSGVIITDRFPATRDGYRDVVGWADAHTVESERAWVIEGTASYGRGLTMALQGRDELVIEFDRPMRKATKDGAKSDALDAIRAAREALGRDKLNQPRSNDGIREAIRVHTVARAAAVRARTAAVNELKAFILTADEQLRGEFRGLRTNKIVTRCSRFRDSAKRRVDERCTRNAMRALARRIQHLETEIADHDTAIKTLIDRAAPQLIAERGIGYVTAAAFYSPGHTPAAATAKPPTPASAAPPRSRSPPAKTKTDIASTEAATANSTGRSTSSPSPDNAAARSPRTT